MQADLSTSKQVARSSSSTPSSSSTQPAWGTSKQVASSSSSSSSNSRKQQFYTWPYRRRASQSPAFLAKYPPGKDGEYNINSFANRRDPYDGKLLVSEQQYNTFLQEYLDALYNGFILYLTENYNVSRPYRYFVELDFDWGTEQGVVEGLHAPVMQIVQGALQHVFSLPEPPFFVMSMRTPYKV